MARCAGSLAEFGEKLREAGLVLGGPPEEAAAEAGRRSGAASRAEGAGVSGGGSGGGDRAVSGGSGGSGRARIPALSRELAHAHASGNTLIATWANFHFHDFAINWARSLRQQVTPFTAAARLAQSLSLQWLAKPGQAAAEKANHLWAVQVDARTPR